MKLITAKRITPKPWLLAALSGILLAAIHPDLNLYLLAPFALTPLWLVIQNEPNWRRRFLLGWLSGILYWGAMCYWIQGTLARHGGMSWALAGFVFVLFALAKGLHSAVFAALGPRHPLAFAALWAGLERTHANFGFPWLTLGDAGVNGILAPLAAWAGVYALSFVFALAAAGVAHTRWAALAVVLCLSNPLAGPESGPHRQALSVQPNFDEEAPPRDPAAVLLGLSSVPADASGGEAPAMILWPEMPVGLYYEQDTLLRERLQKLGRPLITGTVSFAGLRQPRNSAHFLDAGGQAIARYDKMQLVPFGEFVPWPFSTFIDKVSTEAGVFTPGDRVVVARAGELAVGAFICYESAFPHHVREFTRQGAAVLVSLSNDGYFARSAARAQHLALARMRAIENGRWVLRSTNDGYTASISPGGWVVEQAEAFSPLRAMLPFDAELGLTGYARYGDWFAWASLAGALAFLSYRRYAGGGKS
jgi:apolipoprotein N-acyltransferase